MASRCCSRKCCRCHKFYQNGIDGPKVRFIRSNHSFKSFVQTFTCQPSFSQNLNFRHVFIPFFFVDFSNEFHDELYRFVSLRRMSWAPQRHQFILGGSDFHIQSVMTRWVLETRTSIQRWCFMRIATAVQRARNRLMIFDLWQKQRRHHLAAAITGAWRSFALECRFARVHLRKKFTFDLRQVCVQYFLMWGQFVRTARDFQSKAEKKRRFNLLRAQTRHWHVRAVSCASFAASCRRQMTASRLRRLSIFLHEWMSCTKRAVIMRRCTRRLSSFSQMILLRKRFHSWHLVSKRLHLSKLNHQIVAQDQAAANCADCIARFWTKIYVLQCFRNWAALSRNISSRNCSAIRNSAIKKLHLLFRTWLNVVDYCRKRRLSCSLLIIRRRHLLQRLVYYAWAVSARRAAHARMWLEALCVRWQGSFLIRRMHAIILNWRLHTRSCRLSRFKLRRAMYRLCIHERALKQFTMNRWQSFTHAAAQKQHRSSTGQFMLQRNIQASVRRLLSKWLQHSKLRQQMRILMTALNRACDRLLMSKNHDSLQSNFSKWRQQTVQSRARRACCVRVELLVQVRCLFKIALLSVISVRIQRHALSRSFRLWSDCVFRFPSQFPSFAP
jgi:hypothetical protein